MPQDTPAFKIGDRVRVTGEPHEYGHTFGTIKEIAKSQAYGISFDTGMMSPGNQSVHRWYTEDELMPEAEVNTSEKPMDMKSMMNDMIRGAATRRTMRLTSGSM